MPAHNGTDTPTDIQVGPPPPSNAALLMSLAVSAAGATLSLIGCLGGMSAPLVVAGYVITLAGLAGAYYVSSRWPRRVEPVVFRPDTAELSKAAAPCIAGGALHKHFVDKKSSITCPAEVAEGDMVSFYAAGTEHLLACAKAPGKASHVHFEKTAINGESVFVVYFK